MMAQLNKNNYPLWLFLLLSPFLILRFLLIDQIDDSTKTTRLYWLRALGYLGLLIIWFNLISLGDNPPKFEDAEIYNGIVVGVEKGKGRRSSPHIDLKVKDGEQIRFTGIRGVVALLEQQMGKPITIWSYKRWNIFFLAENKCIEIEVSGQRLYKHDWPEVKKRIESLNSSSGLWLLLGLSILIWAFFHIWKLLTKKI
jgi:hypothetical protein